MHQYPPFSYVEVAEQKRLNTAREQGVPWKKWGPYLSERQWGTVREDYSGDGNAWDYFSHDQSRSRAYRWGEDGLAGISDDKQQLCFALALWNEKDPILKERLFGLTNHEGNHGEDVKEYYFYLDSTPTHSYLKHLYKYPQREYPYRALVEINRQRSRREMEYELLDTGIFDEDRYFDVFVEYAKADPEDVLVRISVHNRGPEKARLHLLPTLWFRNTWSWGRGPQAMLRQVEENKVRASHPQLGDYILQCEGSQELLFTNNETNASRLWGQANPSPFVKDAFHEYLVAGRRDAVNPTKTGTKAAAHYVVDVPAGESKVARLRLSAQPVADGFGAFDQIFAARLADADEFYERIIPKDLSEDQRRVYRQALAGMLWSKQYYYFDLDKWLNQHDAHPMEGSGKGKARNAQWFHMLNSDVISMPDKWEYPWYAAWDLAFHTISLSLVDFDFAKEQLLLMLRNLYAHPNGQLPAYEWNFSDVNPPVHAWATLFLYDIEKQLGRADLRFLERTFQGLMLNFSWWVNRKDPDGRNVFAGGFLGLDNIAVFDRSAPLPTGGYLDQADGTAWMAFYCLCMLKMALILTELDAVMYEDVAFRFLDHFFWISYAMDRIGPHRDEMWDEEDGFFYDLLHFPNGDSKRLKVRSMVGLLPLCAAAVFEPGVLTDHPRLAALLELFCERHPQLLKEISPADGTFVGYAGRRLASVCSRDKLQRILAHALDENEFLSPYGIRSLSKYHLDRPFALDVAGQDYGVKYLPAESDSAMFGGNSNWRGPIWMPVNTLIIRGLLNMYPFYGDEFKVECPTGSGKYMTLFEVAKDISLRLARIFLRDESGRRPVYGGTKKFQEDPQWRDYILFYEYFHGDNGAGLGAGHQTGWTGLIAPILDLFARLDPGMALRVPTAVAAEMTRQQVAGT